MEAQTMSQSAVGEYYLTGVRETACGFKLNADNSFQFFFSYGALDRHGEGKWTVKNNEVIFNSAKEPGQDFTLVSSSAGKKDKIVIRIKDAHEMVMRHIYCTISGDGAEQSGMTNSEGEVEFNAQPVDKIEMVFEFCPEKTSVFQVKDKSHHTFEFKPEEWLMETFFHDFHLTITKNGLSGGHPFSSEKNFQYEKNNNSHASAGDEANDDMTESAGPYTEESTNTLYELLFCDRPELYSGSYEANAPYPWSILSSAQPGSEELQAIADDKSLESRTQLLAYHKMKELNYPVEEKQLLGVVVEVGLENGMDTLAAYKDGTARYINQSGKIIIWDAATEKSSQLINDLFFASEAIVEKIGPTEEPRRQAPGKDMMRLSFLVSDGLYFGEGPFNALRQDPYADQIIQAAMELLMFLTEHPDAK